MGNAIQRVGFVWRLVLPLESQHIRTRWEMENSWKKNKNYVKMWCLIYPYLISNMINQLLKALHSYIIQFLVIIYPKLLCLKTTCICSGSLTGCTQPFKLQGWIKQDSNCTKHSNTKSEQTKPHRVNCKLNCKWETFSSGKTLDGVPSVCSSRAPKHRNFPKMVTV